ncbi:3-hydroxyacyl-CoA dehydrogenase NAD-binding domain-containing protein, partial [Aeromonas veronii]|nr:3-hydroxyacyl-CoA dehydrogenase NAD-binding domain-containing protein [Aeromonas veronii]
MRGIAYVSAINGFNVFLTDINQKVLDNAREYLLTELHKSSQLGIIEPSQIARTIERISFTNSLEDAAKNTDFVIEAILENIDLKIEVFKKLDKLCPQHTILATNTSTMSPTEIAAQTS